MAGKANAKGVLVQAEDEGKIEKVEVGPDFVLSDYISGYRGHTRIARLLFIADRVTALEEEALRLAVEHLKETRNTDQYKEVATRLNSLTGKDPLDVKWMESMEKKSAAKLESLEKDLNSYRTNLIKESIRMGYNDLGHFHYDRGDLSAAFKCYLRTRDYCTTSKHMLTMCLNVIKVSIELGNASTVTNYVNKALGTPDWSDAQTATKLRCCAGLAHLEGYNFKSAARQFLDCTFDVGDDLSEVMSPQDVAVYGGLCALASFDRGELRKKVIDNTHFKQYLELTPEVRELIQDFYSSRYASCLSFLEKMRPTLLVDAHLSAHVERLYEDVRKKAMVQYFSPFLSVDLNRMADAFNTDVRGIEKELTVLIGEGQVQARIDSHNKVLYARHADQRAATYQNALKMGQEYQRSTKETLLRVNLLSAEFVVRNPRRSDDPQDSSGRS